MSVSTERAQEEYNRLASQFVDTRYRNLLGDWWYRLSSGEYVRCGNPNPQAGDYAPPPDQSSDDPATQERT